MATCSFLKATDAVSLSRNNTIIWTEICELQKAILAAIDNNERSVIVSEGTPFTFLSGIATATLDAGGSGYSIATATATINANGTGGTGAAVTPILSGGTITSFTIDSGGSGYTPVSATASLAAPVELITAQDETSYTSRFTAGDEYVVGEVITLSESSTVTVDAITPTGVVTTQGQTEVNYDDVGEATANGTFAGGTGYAIADTITLTDGSVITVDNVAAGVVTEFTVTTSSTSSFAADSTLVQLSTSGSGVGFSLTTDSNNEILSGQVLQFTVSSPLTIPFFLGSALQQSSTTGIGTSFTITPVSPTNVNNVVGGTGATLTPIVTNGAITNIVINTAGTGYLPNTPVVITHPSGSGFSGVVSSVGGSGEVLAITIVANGQNYGTVSATVSISHPTGFGFEGTVLTTGGVVTGISIQDGGSLYADVYPYITISDATGTGAEINITGVSGGAITSIQLADGGSNYASPSLLIYNSDGTQNNSATISVTLEADTFNNPNDPNDYYLVLEGQATDRVISDQLQYVLDYFTALGYNIRAQVNPATNSTIQWQIIW